jgi:Bacterial Ig domain/PA14 domain/Secretion system C-terminal sorting domain
MKKILPIILWMLIATTGFAQTSGDWTVLGPKDFPPHLNWQLSGVARISQLKFHPTDPNTLYAVNAMGGLFISKDKGANWLATGADKLPQTRCASVCIDYTNDQILYLGTGDPSYYSQGLGIWKSVNGGLTWNQSTNGMGNRMAVEILMSPLDHNVLMAATNDGIWKSIDGGANWLVKKAGGNFTDMAFRQSTNSSTLYAATMNEFWRSDNMGDTWTRTTVTGNGIQNGGRIGVSKADANVVYLTFVGDHGNNNDTPIFKSTDNGNSFFVVKAAGLPNLNGYESNTGGQGNYNYSLSVNPNDINQLMVVGHLTWRSTNGGVSWASVSFDWAHQVHTDMRQIPFSPYVANEIYNVNDGGIWRSWDNGTSWLPLCNGLVGTESYIGCQSPVRKDAVSIGAQDNGEYIYRAGVWYINGAGDYHSNIIHDNISADYYYDLSDAGRRKGLPLTADSPLNLPFNAGNGQNVYADFPLSNTNVAYLGYNEVYRSANIANNPPTWIQITAINRSVKAVASSPTDANVLYVVTDDGKIRRSDNALSGTPTFITYNTPSATNVTASVVVMKNNTDIVYLLCNNRVYRSGDKGATWGNVTLNLPNVNYHKLLHDVYSTNEAVYVAGYNSIFYKDNTLANWANYSTGLPTVANFYRAYLYNDGTDNAELTLISAGRGVWHTGLYGKTPVLRTPENPENAIGGIVYQYYEGTGWDHVPNFNSLTPVKTGATTIPDLSVRNRNDDYGLTFDGYIDVPQDGKYTFFTSSDDGTYFYIGNEQVISNDGVHGDQERSGYMWLKKGKHKFTLTYFQGVGGYSLNFSWSGPGIAKQLVPANVLYRLSPPNTCPENGSISVEKWTGVGGTAVANIPAGNAANQTFTNPNFESKTDDGDNYGVRYRGYICPPYTGNYEFYIASDDAGELWLSTTGNPANKVRVAYLNGSVNQRNWYSDPSQKSVKIFLKAGQKYYVEGLHKEGGGGDHFAIAWNMPSGEFQAPISGKHLSPYKNNIFPTASITAPVNNYAVISGTNVAVAANAADSDGSVAKVEFYLDDIKLSEDAVAPYTWAWNTVPQGVYLLTARVLDNQGAVTVSNSVKVTVLDLRNPENPALTKKQLDYKYYEYAGDWTALPDFTSLTPVKTGLVPNFDIVIRNRNDHYGVVYAGLIDVPADGIYTFYSDSDDGTKLYFGNRTQLLIAHDGIHGTGAEKSALIGLKAGKHAIVLDFFQNVGGQGLAVSYEGMGIAKQVIPAAVLYREVLSNNPPSILLSSNSNTATSPGSFVLTANAADNDGTVTKVEFYSSGTLLGTVNTSPYVWNLNAMPEGNYTITAKAYDDNNAVTTSNTVTLTVSPANQLPLVSITSPINNAVFIAPANIILQATASDGDGTVQKVEFYNGTIKLGEALVAPYSFAWNTVTVGNYNITAKAYDNLNAVSTSTAITVVVNANQLPNVSITSPLDNAIFLSPASVSIDVTASDADGSVAKVEFYNGATLLSTDNSSPYNYSWTGVTVGTYTITAKAYDDKDAVQISSAITVIVNAVTGINSGNETNVLVSVYPNPVYNMTQVSFDVKESAMVKLALYDLQGKEILVLDEKQCAAGHYEESYRLSELSDGIYLLHTWINNRQFTNKVYKGNKPKNAPSKAP